MVRCRQAGAELHVGHHDCRGLMGPGLGVRGSQCLRHLSLPGPRPCQQRVCPTLPASLTLHPQAASVLPSIAAVSWEPVQRVCAPPASPALRGGKNCPADGALVTVCSLPWRFPAWGSVLEAAQGLCLSSQFRQAPGRKSVPSLDSSGQQVAPVVLTGVSCMARPQLCVLFPLNQR